MNSFKAIKTHFRKERSRALRAEARFFVFRLALAKLGHSLLLAEVTETMMALRGAD